MQSIDKDSLHSNRRNARKTQITLDLAGCLNLKLLSQTGSRNKLQMSDQVQAQSVARQSKENKQQKIIEDLKRCSDETCLEDSH